MPEIDVAVTVVYMAWDTANLEGRTGDDANHTLRGVSDVTEFVPGNAPVEIDAVNLEGLYRLTLTAGENDGSMMTLGGISSTADIVIIPVQWTNKVNTTQVEGLDATDQIADAVLDEVIEGGLTLREITRIMLSALAGQSTGGGTTSVQFRDVADAKDRIDATVTTSGNRTAITLDGA